MRLEGRGWWLALGVVVAGMLVVYSSAANAWWVADDYNYVVPKSQATILHFFDPVGRAQWRPSTWLSWVADWELFGPDPPGWHWTTFLMHGLNMVSAAGLLRAVTGRGDVALLAAVLFGLHPAAPEAVTWIGGRADVSFALWWLPALWLWVRWRQGAGGWGRWAAVAGLAVLALWGKEAAITLPLVAAWIDLLFGRGWARWPGRRDAGWWRDKRTWLLLLRDHAPLWVPCALYGGLRLALFVLGQGRLMYGGDQLAFFGHAPDIALGYLALAVGAWWGADATLAWPLAGKLLLLGLAVLGVGLLVHWLGRVAVFAVGWIGLTLLLTTQAAAPRWFYVPALGVGLLVALAWERLAARPGWRLMAGMTLWVLVVSAWLTLTDQYNGRWVESGQAAARLLAEVRALEPDPPRPATFYVGKPPDQYRGVLFFNSGFKTAMNMAYRDWAGITSYDLDENAAQVAAALADPARLGPYPVYLGYQDGHVVRYPTLAALVAARGR